MDHIEEIEDKITAVQAVYLANANVSPLEAAKASAELKALKAELAAAVADGANPCPSCGGAAFGIRQPRGFEIGCLGCQDHRVICDRRIAAVRAWNDGPRSWKKITQLDPNSALAALLTRLALPQSTVLIPS